MWEVLGCQDKACTFCPGEVFVNREKPLEEILKSMESFVSVAKSPMRTDSLKQVQSLFCVDMFGWGKTELGIQALLQFHRQSRFSINDDGMVSNAWFCYVDLSSLGMLSTSDVTIPTYCAIVLAVGFLKAKRVKLVSLL